MVTSKPHYDACGGILCLDFVNSVGRPAHEPFRETLAAYDDLVLWSEQARSLAPAAAGRLRRAAREDPGGAARVLERARALREASFRAFYAVVQGKRAKPVDLRAINAEVAGALGHARVEAGKGGYAWAFEPSSALDAPLWPIARSAAELLVSDDLERVKECANEHCLWIFLDKTKNHARRWCEMKSCGNRAKVREHRRRKRAEEDLE
ncbi:MAG: hypothetical protein GY711_25195 [bacterium]|nr:hypothetical protein [bacterium]